MVRRHERTAFMAGAHVFPGGRVDAADRRRGRSLVRRLDDAVAALPIRSAAEASRTTWPRRASSSRKPACCSRCQRGGPCVSLADAAITTRSERSPDVHDGARTRCARSSNARGSGWRWTRSCFSRTGSRLPLDIAPVRHAVFLARVPRISRRPTTIPRRRTASGSRQRPRLRAESGEIVLPPPTWTTLRELERFRRSSDALAWARASTVRRKPKIAARRTASGCSSCQATPCIRIPDAEQPAETRSVLVDQAAGAPNRRAVRIRP